MTTINSTDLAQSNDGNISSNFAYSIWFYVNDWAIEYCEEKCIFRCSSNANVIGDLNVYLGTTRNDLTIQIKTTGTDTYNDNYGAYYRTTASCGSTSINCNQINYSAPSDPDNFVQSKCGDSCNAYSYYFPTSVTPIKNTGTTGATGIPAFVYQLFSEKNQQTVNLSGSGYGTKTSTGGKYTNCIVEDIELQKWINLVFSINANTIDIYINGEMVKSQILSGIASISNSNKLFISPNGKGFNGWNSKFQYWTHYMNPRQVKNIYNQGNGSSTTKELRLNVSLYKGDERRANLVI
jgi:hypothetical protein